MTPQEVADRSAAAMWADDKASAGLGMTIAHVAPGEATMTMTVADNMVNGHGICHGGYIFTLADSAFAFACNAYNQRTVAQHCQITYVAPAMLGMHLTATAKERHRAERSGIYDITVRDDTGQVIAEFRGWSRTVAGTLF